MYDPLTFYRQTPGYRAVGERLAADLWRADRAHWLTIREERHGRMTTAQRETAQAAATLARVRFQTQIGRDF